MEGDSQLYTEPMLTDSQVSREGCDMNESKEQSKAEYSYPKTYPREVMW